MPAEGRALASGVLLKEARSGDWSLDLQTPDGFGPSRESFTVRRRCDGIRCTRDASIGLCYLDHLDMPATVCFRVKPVGKPDAVVSHVRFDERGQETGLYVLPRLSSTLRVGLMFLQTVLMAFTWIRLYV